MIVAGVMSGTSADGINVALMRVQGARRARTSGLHRIRFELVGHAEYPYPGTVRKFVLATMNSQRARVADLARLNFLLGELYAEAVLATQRRFRVKAEMVGCHGQTIYHQGEAEAFLGRKLAVTWQTGEAAVIAARLGVPVVSDFRTADMAAGGKGAPLVPYLDFLLYRDSHVGRIVQNIGGIANLTAIPAGASSAQVIAFDTGPGNMVIDAVMERRFHKPYDRDGCVAASGKVLDRVVADTLREPFFRQKPPKTAGREEFGREFADKFVRGCGRAVSRDIVATATALTARSIANSLQRFVLSKRRGYQELIVSGGGARNPTLMAMLAVELHLFGLSIHSSDEFGLPSEAKEAAAFALLAYETWNRRPSNVPSATAAKRPAILGKISYV
jgi:anhydro-N-acetylmuramic acid kinase